MKTNLHELTKPQLKTELSRAQRDAAKAAHAASQAKDGNEKLNAKALELERYVAEVRHVLANDGYPFRCDLKEDERSRTAFYAVHGFWSGRNVTVTQSQSYRKGGGWEPPQINWSCGGRDPKKEPDDLLAAECFGKAIADAVRVARSWLKSTT